MSVKPKIEVGLVLVTVEMAVAWLATRSENQTKRYVRAKAVKWASIMKEGRWHTHGDAIDIDKDGRLSNGQHRLSAVVLCGLPQWFIVARGVETQSFASRDRGYGRSPGQITKWAGYTNADALASAAAIVWLEETGKFGGAWSERTEPEILLDILARHPGLEEAVARANMTACALRLSRGLAGWAYYRFSEIDEEKCESFFEGLKTGAGLSQGDPALVLRNRLMTVRQTRARLLLRDIAALLVRAWNHYYAGRSVQTLKASVRTNGSSYGTFPEIAGSAAKGTR